MSAIFKTKFPAQPWSASAPDAKPVPPAVNAEVSVDFAPSGYFIGSSFADESVNQGRGPSGSAWRTTDALIASLFVAVVAWVCLGSPT